MDGQDMAQAIAEIERLTKAANKTEVLAVPGERTGTYFLVGPDGKAAKQTADPGWHDEKLATPDDLRQFIIDHRGDSNDAVFHDDTRVSWVRDINDRRDRAACLLIQSPQFRWLADNGGKAFMQADFVRTLRVTLRGCLPPDGNLLPLVRQLRFDSASDQTGNVQHGRESLSRNVMAQVTGESALPEDVTLSVQVFENHQFRAPVVCALELLPHERQLRLTPFPLELRRAMDDALESVRKKLSGDDLPPIYRGTP